jgi:hypothetical protein
MLHKKAFPLIFACFYTTFIEGMVSKEPQPSKTPLRTEEHTLPKKLSSIEAYKKELDKIKARVSILDAPEIDTTLCQAKAYHKEIVTLVTLLEIASKNSSLSTLKAWKKLFLILSALDLFEELFGKTIATDSDKCLEHNGYLFAPWKLSLQTSANRLLSPQSYDLSEFFDNLESLETTYSSSPTPF